jgi:hypothetical protein
MTLWKWSKTANNNDTADSTINLRENWAPSVVNNSTRALMAAGAKYRDDISGVIVTGGSGTAYTIASNQNLTALTDGFQIAAKAHTVGGATPTLQVDATSAKPIQSVAGTGVATAAILSGGIYTFIYNLAADAWIVKAGRLGDQLIAASYPDLLAIEALAGTTGALKKTAADTWALDDGVTAIMFETFSGNTSVALTTGVLGESYVPFACTITGVTMLADQSGSAVVDIWADSYANYPPTNDDSITASAPPTISTATKSTDTTLTGWTTSLSAGTTLRYNLDSITTCSRLTVILTVKRFV